MIAKSIHDVFKRFNTVALARVSESEFQIPAEPPFWLLPFLDQGTEQAGRVVFDDELSFVANFLIDAEEKWRTKSFDELSSGIYSVQSGESPELFYECKADSLDGTPVLLIELVGEGSPSSAYESIRAARSQRLADESSGVAFVQKQLAESVDPYLNGLPTFSAHLGKSGQLSSVEFNSLFKSLDFDLVDADSTLASIFGVDRSNEILGRVKTALEANQADKWSYSQGGDVGQILQVELRPEQTGATHILIRDISDRSFADRRLNALAYRSPVTGLLNGQSLQRHSQLATECAQASGTMAGVLQLNIESFSGITSTYGKQAGESLLSAVSQRLLNTLSPIHSAFHLQEDQFCVIVECAASVEQLESIAAVVRAAMSKPYILRFLTHTIAVTVRLDLLS